MKRSVLIRALLGLACYVLLVPEITAQFTLSAEVRPRSEYRHGFKKLFDSNNQDAAFFIEQRTRLVTSYKDSKTEFLVSLQDVRIWGSERQIYKPNTGVSSNFSSIHQAWGRYHLSNSFALKAGRMELDYDNARILGNLAWAQQARSHDALLLEYRDSTSSLDIGAAFNQDANTPEFAKLTNTFYNQVGNYKTMQYAHYHKNFTNGGLSALFLNNGLQAPQDSLGNSKTRFSQTVGLIGDINISKIKLELEGYYQFGKDGAGRQISAFLLGASATTNITSKTSVTVGGDYLSGSSLTDTKNHSFNPLYGTHHKFYGFMDYFYVGNASAQMGKTIGLINPYTKFKFGIGKGKALLAHLHHFLSPVTIYSDPESRSGDLSASLGTEVDLVFNANLSATTNLKVGYSQLFATESMQQIKGGNPDNTQNWFWVMMTFKPTLFQSK